MPQDPKKKKRPGEEKEIEIITPAAQGLGTGLSNRMGLFQGTNYTAGGQPAPTPPAPTAGVAPPAIGYPSVPPATADMETEKRRREQEGSAFTKARRPRFGRAR